jgi:hypothetical protein
MPLGIAATHRQAREVAPILHREGAEQQRFLGELENALAQQNYDRVDELVSSLDASLRQQALDKETEALELRVMRAIYKTSSQ